MHTSAPSSSSSPGCEQIKCARITHLIKHSGATVDSCSTSAVPAALSERWKPPTPQLHIWQRRKVNYCTFQPSKSLNGPTNELVWETEASPRCGSNGEEWEVHEFSNWLLFMDQVTMNLTCPKTLRTVLWPKRPFIPNQDDGKEL